MTIRKAPDGAKPAKPSKRWIIERLSAFYTEEVCKNPRDSVYDNIERAVERLPVVGNAWELLDELESILTNFRTDGASDSRGEVGLSRAREMRIEDLTKRARGQ